MSNLPAKTAKRESKLVLPSLPASIQGHRHAQSLSGSSQTGGSPIPNPSSVLQRSSSLLLPKESLSLNSVASITSNSASSNEIVETRSGADSPTPNTTFNQNNNININPNNLLSSGSPSKINLQPSLAPPPVFTFGEVLNHCRLRLFFPRGSDVDSVPSPSELLEEISEPQKTYVVSGETLRLYVIITPPETCFSKPNRLEKFIDSLAIKIQTSIRRIGGANSLSKQRSFDLTDEGQRNSVMFLQTFFVHSPKSKYRSEDRRMIKCGNSFIFPINVSVDHPMNMVHEFSHMLCVSVTVEQRHGDILYDSDENSNFATFNYSFSNPLPGLLAWNDSTTVSNTISRMSTSTKSKTVNKFITVHCPIKLSTKSTPMATNLALISFEIKNVHPKPRQSDRSIQSKRWLTLDERNEDTIESSDEPSTTNSWGGFATLDTPPILDLKAGFNREEVTETPSEFFKELQLVSQSKDGIRDFDKEQTLEIKEIDAKQYSTSSSQSGGSPSPSNTLLSPMTPNIPALSQSARSFIPSESAAPSSIEFIPPENDPLEVALASRKQLMEGAQETFVGFTIEKVELQLVKIRETIPSAVRIEDYFGIRTEKVCPITLSPGESGSFVFSLTLLKDVIPKEVIDLNSQYFLKFIITWKALPWIAASISYDFQYPFEIPSIFQQRIDSEILLSYTVDSSIVRLNQVFNVTVQLVNGTNTAQDFVLRVGEGNSPKSVRSPSNFATSEERFNPFIDSHIARDAIVPLDSFIELETLQGSSSCMMILRFMGLKTGFHNLPKIHLYDRKTSKTFFPVQDSLAVFVSE